MRCGKELILATREFAKEDRFKSWFYTISTLAVLVLLFVGTIWNFHILGKITCGILAGFVMIRMFTIYHDYLHGTILQKSRIADIIMKPYGVFVLNPPSVWKLSHDYHHKHNSKLFAASIGSYPIMTTKRFLSSCKMDRFKYLAFRHPLFILFGYLFVFIIGMCLTPFLRDPKKHLDAGITLVIHFLLLFAAYYLGGWEMIVFSIAIPFFLSCTLGAYLFYAQHNFPGVTFKSNNHDWSYSTASLESSSYMVMGPVMRWFFGNIGYHHIHHINAHIPFYRLPEVMEKIPELQFAKKTSLSPVEIYRCLQLKIWDGEAKEMIGMRKFRQNYPERSWSLENRSTKLSQELIDNKVN